MEVSLLSARYGSTTMPIPITSKAQYSLPFLPRVAAFGGAEALMPLSPEWLHRQDIVALARRVSLHVNTELDARFRRKPEPGFAFRLAAGFSSACRHPFGDPANPMDITRLVAKFKKLTAGVISPQAQVDLFTH